MEQRPFVSSPSRIPALDGLRSISILLVLLHHWAIGYVGEVPGALRRTLFSGELGVKIFFVISAYIITRLLTEQNLPDEPLLARLRDFYLRRIAKLVPSLWLFVALAGLAGLLRGNPIPVSELMRAATFTAFAHQWFSANGAAVGHTWSLSVEEVYYLTWVPFLLLVRSRRALGWALAASFLVAVTSRGTELCLGDPPCRRVVRFRRTRTCR